MVDAEFARLCICAASCRVKSGEEELSKGEEIGERELEKHALTVFSNLGLEDDERRV